MHCLLGAQRRVGAAVLISHVNTGGNEGSQAGPRLLDTLITDEGEPGRGDESVNQPADSGGRWREGE